MSMSDTQSVCIMGNLVREAELKQVGEQKTSFCSTVIASNDRRQNKEEVLFLPIVTFNKTAELLARHGRKGKKVLVTGRLVSRTRADESSYVELNVQDLKFIDGKGGEENNEDRS
jgi:single-strand DNA-binding protein